MIGGGGGRYRRFEGDGVIKKGASKNVLKLFIFFIKAFFLAFVYSTMCDAGNFFRTSTIPSNICHLVESFNTRHHVSKYSGELSVHVGQNHSKLRRNLEKITIKRFCFKNIFETFLVIGST